MKGFLFIIHAVVKEEMTKLLISHGKIPSIHETVQKEVSPCLWSAETLQANSCSHDWIVFKLVPPNDNISGYVSLPVLTLDVNYHLACLRQYSENKAEI